MYLSNEVFIAILKECIYVCIYVYGFIRMYICMDMCIWIYTYVYMSVYLLLYNQFIIFHAYVLISSVFILKNFLSNKILKVHASECHVSTAI